MEVGYVSYVREHHNRMPEEEKFSFMDGTSISTSCWGEPPSHGRCSHNWGLNGWYCKHYIYSCPLRIPLLCQMYIHKDAETIITPNPKDAWVGFLAQSFCLLCSSCLGRTWLVRAGTHSWKGPLPSFLADPGGQIPQFFSEVVGDTLTLYKMMRERLHYKNSLGAAEPYINFSKQGVHRGVKKLGKLTVRKVLN